MSDSVFVIYTLSLCNPLRITTLNHKQTYDGNLFPTSKSWFSTFSGKEPLCRTQKSQKFKRNRDVELNIFSYKISW